MGDETGHQGRYERGSPTFRGKGHTLPGFSALCQRCDDLYTRVQDDELVEIMKFAPGWLWDSFADIDERLRTPLVVFRHADKGARPLAPDQDR